MSKSEDYTYKKTEPDKSEVQLEIIVGKKRFLKEKDKVFTQLSKNIEISGFRKGKAPKNLIEAKLGPSLFEETLNHLLPEITAEIIQGEKLVPITQVQYKVSKVSDGGVSYVATFTLYPEIKLGDFKKIKVKKEDGNVTKDEVDKVIENMFQEAKKKEDAKSEESDSSGDTRAVSSKKIEPKKSNLKLDDAWAKSLNLGVPNLKELRNQTKLQLELHKKQANRDKYASDIVMEAIKLSKFDTPKSLVESELDRREADYKGRIENLGLKLDDYLRSQKTTMEKLKEEWKEDAMKKVQVEILLTEVARANHFHPGDDEIEKEIRGINDEKQKEFYSTPRGKSYIRSVLIQQKAINHILSIVEGRETPKKPKDKK